MQLYTALDLFDLLSFYLVLLVGFHHVHASAVAAAREVGGHVGGVASAHTEPARGVGPVGAPAPGGNPGREERRGGGAEEEHLPRRADEGAGGAPSSAPGTSRQLTNRHTLFI